MKNSINVYWCRNLEFPKKNSLLTEPLTPVLSDYNSIYKNNPPFSQYLKCPAVANEWKNTFVLKSPFDFTLDINPQDYTYKVSIDNKFVDYFHELIGPRSLENRLFDLYIEWNFFSDSSVEISQIPASLHPNEFTSNTNLFSGKYNISKWIRPLIPTFMVNYSFIHVKKGDALCYIKLHTNKKVKLINFELTDKIDRYIQECVDVKIFKSNIKLFTLYSWFTRMKYHKKILKEIKQNTTNLK